MLGGGEPSGDHGAAAGPSGAQEDGGSGSVAAAASAMFGSTSNNNNSGDDDKGRVDDSGGGFGGNRWPRQETLALLKIRSDMDVAFRDASVKGPLWDEVSRKLAELGYHRSAKKCKEKFENVYKYHKRTKEGRTGKQDGKAYRFFDQLEALETQHSISSPPPAAAAAPPRVVPTTMPPNPPSSLHHVTIPSTTTSSFPQNIVTTTPLIPSSNPTIQQPLQMANPITHPSQPFSHNISSADLMSNSTSSSTSSDIELGGRHKRKRKWKDFFERLMREVMEKQEEMQKKFLEAIEKREHERMVREEAWRMQEMTRINREREILAQERSLAAAKDTAVMTFLQKLSEQQNPGQLVQNHPPQAPPVPSQQPAVVAPTPAPPPQRTPTSVQPLLSIIASAPVPPPPPPPAVTNLDLSNIDNGVQNSPAVSSSRWPKVEIEALIELRTDLDAKYQENGPKGPLWEEISAGMKRLGYNRNAKRCKEKWENINKYFKKVKESNKKRPEDSKTCPYFHQLDALYRKKNKVDSSSQIKPENSVPLMVRPEQQWPPPPPPSSEPENQHDSVVEEIESEHEHEDDKDGDDEEEDEGGEYEIVASKPVSLGTSE